MMTDTKATTATNIPAILKAQGRKVWWFCQSMNISQSYYHMIERGERVVPGEYLATAAAVLDVTIEKLTEGRSE